MSQLTIYRASAGSGKTFRLVLEYLKLLMDNPYNYKHILAVTFTNKATTEMKERILKALYSISIGKQDTLYTSLIAETGLDHKRIMDRSTLALSNILHDYDRFAISTIDSFFQRVLRSFARESGLYGTYEIDLDQDALLEEACDRLLLSIDQDVEMRNWLLTMSEDQLGEGGNWQINQKILELGKELYKESFQVYLNHYEGIDTEREKLKILKNDLMKTRKWFESEMEELGQKGLDLIHLHGLQTTDFIRGKQSFVNYFSYWAEGRMDKLNPTKTLLSAVNDVEKWYSKTSPQKPAIEACFNAGLNAILVETLTFLEQKKKDYVTAVELQKQVYALGVLTSLSAQIREIGKEKNTLLLSEGNLLLRGIIGNNDTPFIYEKAGTYYRFFMIDEFQDTSTMQWDNLKPLVLNSLSENHPNLVVGDVKQSIYRWRNSDWQLLNKYIKEDLIHATVKEEALEANYRSSKQIVTFNNQFFESAKELLQDNYNDQFASLSNKLKEEYGDTIRQAYHDVTQKPQNMEDGGMVRFAFLDKDEAYTQTTHQKVIEAVKEVQDLGYEASDIAILVKKNKEGKQLAEALLNEKGINYNFEVISDDTLFIDTSSSVRFITQLLRYILSPYDRVIQASIVHEYASVLLPLLEKEGKVPPRLAFEGQQLFSFETESHHLISEEVVNNYFPFFKTDEKKTTAQKWSYRSLIELTDELISLYGLDTIPGEQAALQAFKDVVNDFSRKESGNLHKFAEWWSEFGNKVKLQSAGERNAIQIMTIHKSKGLEFPIVMIPFCDWQFSPDSRKSNILWCSTENSNFNHFPVLPVKFTKQLEDSHFKDDYFTEILLSYIDNLNVMYVAFTRAEKALYVFTENKELKGTVTASGVCNAIINGPMRGKLDAQEDDSFWQSGNLNHAQKQKQTRTNEVNLSVRINAKSRLNNALKLKRNYIDFIDQEASEASTRINEGKLLHELLSLIKVKNDVALALEQLSIQGKLEREQKDAYQQKLEVLMHHELAENWFSGDHRVLNETTILTGSGGIKRPDRVMIQHDKVVVVDYKSTEKISSSHQRQVQNYVDEIKKMGYRQVEGYVWYLKSNQIKNIKTAFNGN